MTIVALKVVISSQAGAITGAIAACTESPIDFYKSQIQVQIIRTQSDPNYKGQPPVIMLQAFWCSIIKPVFYSSPISIDVRQESVRRPDCSQHLMLSQLLLQDV